MNILYLILFFIIAYIIGELFEMIKLPKLLGYLLLGLFIGNTVTIAFNEQILHIITAFALTTLLTKAGLSLEQSVFKKIGVRSILLGVIPNILEALIVSVVVYYLLSFTIYESLMLGFIISAVSPAVIIPSMLRIKEEGYDKEVTTLSITFTSIDDVLSISMFYMFLSFYLNEGTSYLMVPISFILGILFGLLLGFIMKYFVTLSKNKYQNTLLFISLFIITFIVYLYGDVIYITPTIALMSFGYYMLNHHSKVGKYMLTKYKQVWNVAQVMLFFIIGFITKFELMNSYIFYSMVIISIGLPFRYLGVLLSLIESRYNIKQRLFILLSNTPKATVQASLAAVPLIHFVTEGDVIQSIAVSSIVLTAPIGLLLIELTYKKLLKK